MVDWASFIRDVFEFALRRTSVILRGLGRVVEIDEAKFGKRKNNNGRVIKEQWVVGGIDRITGDTFLVAVAVRNRRTLIAVVRKWIRSVATVVTDNWASYRTLSEYDFHHLSVNHSKNCGPQQRCTLKHNGTPLAVGRAVRKMR